MKATRVLEVLALSAFLTSCTAQSQEVKLNIPERVGQRELQPKVSGRKIVLPEGLKIEVENLQNLPAEISIGNRTYTIFLDANKNVKITWKRTPTKR